MSKTNRFAQLLELYLSGNISADEHEELFDLISTHEYDSFLTRAVHRSLAKDPVYASTDLPPHVAEEIVRHIFNSEKNASKVLPLKKPARLTRWLVAASIIALVGMGSYLFLSYSSTSNASFVSKIPANTIVYTNDKEQPKTVTLSDGSKVILKPNSKLHYTRDFNTTRREVFLEGEAFFDIAKDHTRPFFVHCNTLVARVLGTSFTISPNAQTGEIEVAVRTGKVQVFENDTEKSEKDRIYKAIILTPNQRLFYKPKERLFETLLVEKPEPIDEKQIVAPFIYEDETLEYVFNHIELKYGIEIVVENSNINNCRFTGDVSAQDLFTKLDMICLATNASYEVNGTKILIKGSGCNPD
jgi:ferric-dicitrate binding protein FerR (iron transport regulator)